MSTKNLLNLIIIFLVLVLIGILLYGFLGSGWGRQSRTVLQPSKKNKGADFQIILPEGSIYKLTEIKNLEIDAEMAPSIWFEKPEKAATSLLGERKVKFVDGFLSESKPFGKITISGTQQDKAGNTLYLNMSAYVFYRPFAEKNFPYKLQKLLDPYLWPISDQPIIIDAHSTAISCLIDDYLVFSGLPSSEHPFSISFVSSPKAIAHLDSLLSNPKFLELKDEVKKFLTTGLDSPTGVCFEKKISDIDQEIIGPLKEPSVSELKEMAKKLPQTKDAEISFQIGQKLGNMAATLENYDELNINNSNVKFISDKVAENGGKLIIHKPSSPAYKFCAYSRLNAKRNGSPSWYCIENTGEQCYTTIDPSTTCNKNSYTCPCQF